MYVGDVFPSEVSNSSAAGFELHFSSDSTVLYLSYSTPSFPYTVHLRANVSDILNAKVVNFVSGAWNRTSSFSLGQYDSTWIFGSRPSSSYLSLYAQQGGPPINDTMPPLRLDYGNNEAGPLEHSLDLVNPITEATSGNLSLLRIYPDGLFISAMTSEGKGGPIWVLNIVDVASHLPVPTILHWAREGKAPFSANAFHGVTASGEKRLCLIYISPVDKPAGFSFNFGCSLTGDDINQKMAELSSTLTYNAYLNNYKGALSPNGNWYFRLSPVLSKSWFDMDFAMFRLCLNRQEMNTPTLDGLSCIDTANSARINVVNMNPINFSPFLVRFVSIGFTNGGSVLLLLLRLLFLLFLPLLFSLRASLLLI